MLEMRQEALKLQFQKMTGMYRPSGWGFMIPGLVDLGLPLFTIRRVEAMKYDADVRLAMAVKSAPLLTVKFQLSGRPEICQFMAGEIQRTWYYAVPRILEALWYSRSGGEIVNKLGDDGKIHFGEFFDVYPSDIFILTRGGSFAGIQVSAQSVVMDDNNYYDRFEANDKFRQKGKITLFPPKSFLYVHNRRFGSWNGRSELLGCFSPWLDKWDQNGALAIRRMWFYKNAYIGFWVEHPPGEYLADSVAGAPPLLIPYRDLARQFCETIRTGGVFGLPFHANPADPKTSMWSVHFPEITGDAAGLNEYVHELRADIFHGAEIPDDVLTAATGIGGLAGRSVPALSFFTSQQIHLRAIVEACRQCIWDPIAMMNFGSTDYHVEASVDVDRLLPSMPSKSGTDENEEKPEEQRQMGVESDSQFSNAAKSIAATASGFPTAAVRFVDESGKPIKGVARRWNAVETIAA